MRSAKYLHKILHKRTSDLTSRASTSGFRHLVEVQQAQLLVERRRVGCAGRQAPRHQRCGQRPVAERRQTRLDRWDIDTAAACSCVSRATALFMAEWQQHWQCSRWDHAARSSLANTRREHSGNHISAGKCLLACLLTLAAGSEAQFSGVRGNVHATQCRAGCRRPTCGSSCSCAAARAGFHSVHGGRVLLWCLPSGGSACRTISNARGSVGGGRS
jgi:hypothetical protein